MYAWKNHGCQCASRTRRTVRAPDRSSRPGHTATPPTRRSHHSERCPSADGTKARLFTGRGEISQQKNNPAEESHEISPHGAQLPARADIRQGRSVGEGTPSSLSPVEGGATSPVNPPCGCSHDLADPSGQQCQSQCRCLISASRGRFVRWPLCAVTAASLPFSRHPADRIDTACQTWSGHGIRVSGRCRFGVGTRAIPHNIPCR